MLDFGFRFTKILARCKLFNKKEGNVCFAGLKLESSFVYNKLLLNEILLPNLIRDVGA